MGEGGCWERCLGGLPQAQWLPDECWDKGKSWAGTDSEQGAREESSVPQIGEPSCAHTLWNSLKRSTQIGYYTHTHTCNTHRPTCINVLYVNYLFMFSKTEINLRTHDGCHIIYIVGDFWAQLSNNYGINRCLFTTVLRYLSSVNHQSSVPIFNTYSMIPASHVSITKLHTHQLLSETKKQSERINYAN